MSRVLYDFLSESFLFRDDYISAQYGNISEAQLESELRKYREHALSRLDELRSNLTTSPSRLSVYFDSTASVSTSVLKQSALYYDRAIMDDPIFRESRPHDPMPEFRQMVGHPRKTVDRAALAQSAHFMKEVTPMVAGGFAGFAPISLTHEPPKMVPLLASGNFFEERVPPELRAFFDERTSAFSVEVLPGGKGYVRHGPLAPCRHIGVKFGDYPSQWGYFLPQLESTRIIDEERRIVEFVQSMPDTPPDETVFLNWVRQSKNLAAADLLNHVATDVNNAAATRSYLCANSAFVADLLALERTSSTPEEDIARLALRLELPIVDGVSMADLMCIRSNEGESFEIFRTELAAKLRDIRHVADPAAQEAKLRDLEHDFSVTQVERLSQQLVRLKRDLWPSLALGAVSMTAILIEPQIKILGLAGVAISATAAGVKYLNSARQIPALFLWKLKKNLRPKDR
ncbi:hypothetical protein [Melittangium boletus]|uniref:Uncharacterized protein n=1 Tax=Melittangium boletus DSM 14713 TaxID=1294270 RepID=A0A250IQQ5_9BACT|nr:hypothetical protein [Melittangium boletus]ATB33583.1 hypothetical protein MEBOL_007081 [Melittangium boletus DSM 14713]